MFDKSIHNAISNIINVINDKEYKYLNVFYYSEKNVINNNYVKKKNNYIKKKKMFNKSY